VDAIAAAIRAGIVRKERGEPVPAVPLRLLEHFERSRLSGRLAAVFDGVLGPVEATPAAAAATG
jgi:hypothetical protein